MKFNKKQMLGLVVGSLAIFQVNAANIILKDGRNFEGEIKSQNSETLVLDMNGLEMILPITEINSIDLTKTNELTKQIIEQPVELETGIATIAAGSPLMVKINDGFNTRHHKTGQRFTGILESNLVSEGVIVAPKGSSVYGVLTDVKKAGRIAGSASLSFELTDISIGGTMQPLNTQTLSGAGDNTAKSTVGKTAGAAAIGGLINGSSGAKNGAKVGLGAAILTPGSDIEVPSNTLIEFVLSAPFSPS
jgi:hypothetical protein